MRIIAQGGLSDIIYEKVHLTASEDELADIISIIACPEQGHVFTLGYYESKTQAKDILDNIRRLYAESKDKDNLVFQMPQDDSAVKKRKEAYDSFNSLLSQ